MMYLNSRYLLPLILLLHLLSQVLMANIFPGRQFKESIKHNKLVLDNEQVNPASFVNNAEILKKMKKFSMLNVNVAD